MIKWDGSNFLIGEENLKVFSSDFPYLADIVGEAEKAARHARESGCQINSPASWLRAWLKKANGLAAMSRTKRSGPVIDVQASKAWHDARLAREREAWLEAHCLNQAGLPGDVYVSLLREEIKHMVRKGALR